jgi:hypothetical protein
VKELNPSVVLFDRFMMEEQVWLASVKTVLMPAIIRHRRFALFEGSSSESIQREKTFRG